MSTTTTLDAVAAELGALARRDVALGPLTTYRVGGAAALFVRVETLADLRRVAQAVANAGVPTLVVGRGSNLLVADAGFDGVAVSLGAIAEQIELDDAVARAGASVLLPVLARRTAAAGL